MLVLCLGFTPLSGCGDGDPGVAVRDRNGRQVPLESVEIYRGADHCGWQGVTFLRLGARTGQGIGGKASMYIRDPDGLLADQTVSQYDPKAILPQDARFTGYSSDAGDLWLSAGDQDNSCLPRHR